MPIDEITAFLSCLISNSNEYNFKDPEISKEFTNAIKELKKINDKIDEQERKSQYEESHFNRKIDFSNAPNIKRWMEGEHFSEILEECDLEEGKVYSMINRLSGLVNLKKIRKKKNYYFQ